MGRAWLQRKEIYYWLAMGGEKQAQAVISFFLTSFHASDQFQAQL
jgi:hypothetical protein